MVSGALPGGLRTESGSAVRLDDWKKICYHDEDRHNAGMVKSVDTRDLKSLAVKSVPVRVRLPAPCSHPDFDRVGVGFFFLIFDELPIIPALLEQIEHFRIQTLECV